MDKKTIAILLLIILCAIAAYFDFRPSKPKDDDKIHRMEDSLITVNKALKHNFDSIAGQDKIKTKKVDSLENLKPKTVIQYVKIYEKIDHSTTHELTNRFDSILSNSGIK